MSESWFNKPLTPLPVLFLGHLESGQTSETHQMDPGIATKLRTWWSLATHVVVKWPPQGFEHVAPRIKKKKKMCIGGRAGGRYRQGKRRL